MTPLTCDIWRGTGVHSAFPEVAEGGARPVDHITISLTQLQVLFQTVWKHRLCMAAVGTIKKTMQDEIVLSNLNNQWEMMSIL